MVGRLLKTKIEKGTPFFPNPLQVCICDAKFYKVIKLGMLKLFTRIFFLRHQKYCIFLNRYDANFFKCNQQKKLGESLYQHP